MSSAKYNSLFKYNEQVFTKLQGMPHLQLGFFSGDDVLFVGQNPGAVYNTRTSKLTEAVSVQTTWAKSQAAYKRMMKATLMGKYLMGVVGKEWANISFTNVVKVATEGNSVPTHEQYEFFFPILMTQIDILEPKLIACLGKYAGSVFGLDEYYYARRYKSSVVCMYPHPSYIMRQGMNVLVNEQARMTLSIDEMLGWSAAAKQTYENEKQLQ